MKIHPIAPDPVFTFAQRPIDFAFDDDEDYEDPQPGDWNDD